MEAGAHLGQLGRVCAFCRRPAAMTAEHVWGAWLKPFVPVAANKHYLHQRLVGRHGTQPRDYLQTKAGGSPLNSTVRVVCAKCNSGWLSSIQNTAKPHLVPLIQGSECIIGADAQAAIATWATMASMTAEFISRKLHSIAISSEARFSFMMTRSALPRWRIWIGHYRRRRWDGTYVHACQPIYHEGDLVIPNVQDRDVPLPTTQWSTFVVGQLYVHLASSSTSADWIETWDWRNAPRARRLLVEIHPRREQLIKWPTALLSDEDPIQFSQAHWQYLHNRFGGPH